MIERPKQAVAPLSQQVKALSAHEMAQENLFKTIRAMVAEKKMNRRQGELATMYLLSDPVLGLANEELLLEKYSKKEIDAAINEADEAVEAGTTFGKHIAALRAQVEGVTNAISGAPKEAVKEVTDEALTRLANITFNTESEGLDGNERRVQEKLARWAVIHIARWSLRKTPEEVGAITKLAPATITTTIRSAREEYLAKHTFYDKVNLICKELGIPRP